MWEFQLSDPDRMPPKALEMFDRLREMDRGEFDDLVYTWATGDLDNKVLSLALLHPEMIGRTSARVKVLVRRTEEQLTATRMKIIDEFKREGHLPEAEYQKLMGIPRYRELRKQAIDLSDDQKALGGVGSQLRPLANEAQANKARGIKEERGLKVLKQVYYIPYMEIMKDINKGMSVADATARAEQRPTQIRHRSSKKK